MDTASRAWVRRVLEALMVVLLLGQMMRQFMPGVLHEVTGVLLALVAVAHVLLNGQWFAGLRRGRWTPLRVLSTCVAVVLCVTFAAMLVSGLGMSGVAVGLGLAHGTMRLRSIHLALVHLGFLVAGIHAGLHALPLVRRAGRHVSARLGRMGWRVLAGVVGVALVLAGAWQFAQLDFASYMTLKLRFAFIDPSQSVVLFALRHLAVFCGCVVVGCLLAGACSGLARRRRARLG